MGVDACPAHLIECPGWSFIDDEESARYIARQLFRGTRYRVLEAAGGNEGTERALFEHPALILPDLGMTERSGFAVLDDLKSDPATAGIPVVINTSRKLESADYERLLEGTRPFCQRATTDGRKR